MDNVLIFDNPYSLDKQAEGIAVAWAVVAGLCEFCPVLSQCESDPDFEFPQDMACMVRKREILREWGVSDGK